MKINRSFRKGLKEKKFNSMCEMLGNTSERKLFKESFVKNPEGRYIFKPPEDKKKDKEIRGILKKLHKARRGPRTLRLLVLLTLLGAPVVFYLFFMDRIASSSLEKTLESLVETDVQVEGLDIRVLQGRIILNKLSFASQSDPMVDSLVLDSLAADVNWNSIFFRRFVLDELSGSLALNVPRQIPAEYPRKSNDSASAQNSDDTRKTAIELSEFASAASPLIPNETLELVQNLSSKAESANHDWSAGIEKETAEIKSLGDRVNVFLSEPLPGKTDVQGWKDRVEEGKKLSEEIAGKKDLVEKYRRDLDAVVRQTEDALVQAQTAVNADLNRVKNTLNLSNGLINQWLETNILKIAGPKAAIAYRKVSGLILRIKNNNGSRDTEDKDSEIKKGRMKRGRIVYFPASRPPRFSIRQLHLSGEGIRIDGSNIGVDQDLAGAPSVVSLKLDNFSAHLILDMRQTAETELDGRIELRKLPWRSSAELPGGMISGEMSFSVSGLDSGEAQSEEIISSCGHVMLSDWEAVEKNNNTGGRPGGPLSLIGNGSAPLAFNYEYQRSGGKDSFKLMVDKSSLEQWGRMLADSALDAGKAQLSGKIPPEIESELDNLEMLIKDGEAEKDSLHILSTELEKYQDDLAAVMETSIPEGTPIPGASGIFQGAASLFGN